MRSPFCKTIFLHLLMHCTHIANTHDSLVATCIVKIFVSTKLKGGKCAAVLIVMITNLGAEIHPVADLFLFNT